MADALANSYDVADDFVDARGWGKVSWLLLAIGRFLVTIAGGFFFLLIVATLDLRSAADSAAGGRNYQSEIVQQDLRKNAQSASTLHTDVDRLTLIEADQSKQLDRAAADLRDAASRAKCGSDTPSVDEANLCVLKEPHLSDELTQKAQIYADALKADLDSKKKLSKAAFDYNNAQFKPGSELEPLVPILADKDSLASMVPFVGPIMNFFFRLPTGISSILMAFMGGIVGAACLMFILIAFPNYLPLTFGGGKDFFMRMAMGGIVAVVVQLLMLTGTAVPLLQGVQSAAANIKSSAQGQAALIAVAAGFLSQQLAGLAKGYVDAAFHGGATPSGVAAPAAPVTAPSAPAPAALPSGGLAMGPGAMEALNG